MKFGIRNSELGIGLNRHPERSAKRGVEGSSARFFIPLVVAAFAILAPAAHAQQNSDIDAVKKRAELNSAKADLEEARKKRDISKASSSWTSVCSTTGVGALETTTGVG